MTAALSACYLYTCMYNCREARLSFFEEINIFNDPELYAHFLPRYCKHSFYLWTMFLYDTL